MPMFYYVTQAKMLFQVRKYACVAFANFCKQFVNFFGVIFILLFFNRISGISQAIGEAVKFTFVLKEANMGLINLDFIFIYPKGWGVVFTNIGDRDHAVNIKRNKGGIFSPWQLNVNIATTFLFCREGCGRGKKLSYLAALSSGCSDPI